MTNNRPCNLLKSKNKNCQYIKRQPHFTSCESANTESNDIEMWCIFRHHKSNQKQCSEKRCRVRQKSLKIVLDLGVCMRLNCGKWKNVVTTNEATCYMFWSFGRRRVCYVRSNETDFNKLKFVKRVSFAPGFMVWAGVSYYGKTSLIFIAKGVEVNANYYINKVLKSFLTKDVPHMFPGREKEMVFHQDSTFNHTAKRTINFLNKC